ncbi:hypothetical protein AB0H63_32340 [Micromonospora echinospora]|uniref:hypothetical protein n=1 Tax=Micromonospora echinospora TaxID=1877 RepID=UPI00340325CB
MKTRIWSASMTVSSLRAMTAMLPAMGGPLTGDAERVLDVLAAKGGGGLVATQPSPASSS